MDQYNNCYLGKLVEAKRKLDILFHTKHGSEKQFLKQALTSLGKKIHDFMFKVKNKEVDFKCDTCDCNCIYGEMIRFWQNKK